MSLLWLYEFLRVGEISVRERGREREREENDWRNAALQFYDIRHLPPDDPRLTQATQDIATGTRQIQTKSPLSPLPIRIDHHESTSEPALARISKTLAGR